MDSDSTLGPSFKRLSHGLQDFMRTAATDNAVGLLKRLVAEMDKEPLRGFVATAVPSADFQKWWIDHH